MFSSLLIALREGLEAVVLVGIIITFLVRTGRSHAVRDVWIGVAAALAVSGALGLSVALGAASFSDRAQEMFEGVASVVAAVVLTWMILWMRRQATSIRSALEARADLAVTSGSKIALAMLAFTAVAREGLETVLFLYAAFRQSGSAVASGMGAVLGLGIALGLGLAIYRGGQRMNLGLFFKATGAMLIVVAAGLLATAVHEFNEAGHLIALSGRAWDTGALISSEGVLGSVLRGLIGYRSAPTVLEAIIYWAYLIPILTAFFGLPAIKRSVLTGAEPA